MGETKNRCGAAKDPCGGTGRKTAAQSIFETARELFYRRGVRAVGVEEIVAQAGVTKPSLYRAYPSKDALVEACLAESAAEGIATLDAVIEAAGPDPLAQLRALVAHYAEEIADPEFRGCPLSNAAVEFPEPGHPGRAVIEDCKTAMRRRVGELTRRLEVRDPELLADAITLVIEGAGASHHVFGSQGPAAALSAAVETLIEGAMSKAPVAR